MKKIILSIILLAVSQIATAQVDFSSILLKIETNSTTLQSLREQMRAQKLENRTNIFLSDPEIEFAYLWGNTPVIGDRTDFKILQSFDFPSVYSHKSKVSQYKNESSELLYKAGRTSILLEAKQICIELIYYNALAKEISKRLGNAELIADTYKKKLEKGEANIIDNNKIQLNVISLQNEATGIESKRIILLSELKQLNGGQEIAFDQSNYSGVILPDNFEDWYSKVALWSPVLQYSSKQITIRAEEVRLNRAQVLPKFSAGYMSEQLLGEKFQGVTVGLTIPIWSNKNKIRHSKAQLIATQSQFADNKIEHYTRLQGLYDKAVILQRSALKYREALSSFNNEPLLKRALDAGEISLLTYLNELDYHYLAYRQVLETEKNLELTLGELFAFDL